MTINPEVVGKEAQAGAEEPIKKISPRHLMEGALVVGSAATSSQRQQKSQAARKRGNPALASEHQPEWNQLAGEHFAEWSLSVLRETFRKVGRMIGQQTQEHQDRDCEQNQPYHFIEAGCLVSTRKVWSESREVDQ
jgi:hypothetical protein